MNIGPSTPLRLLSDSKSFSLPPRPSFAVESNQEPETLSEGPSDTIEPSAIDSKLVHLVPFPTCSVNLITCSSNSGKTHFLDQVIRHRSRFFENASSITHLVYVNGNQRDFSAQHPWASEEEENESANTVGLDITSLSLDEFADYNNILEKNTLLILDDILKLNDDIEFIVKYGAHHFSLASVFIVTQSCLSSPLYSLVGSVHNIVLLFGNTATTRLVQHLIQSFFLCFDTKKYLKSILGLAEKTQDIVILKLNSIASHRLHSTVLAITHVRHLLDSLPYCIVYPEIGHLESLKNKMPRSASAHVPITDEYLDEAFVLLPASQVKHIPDNEDEKPLCHDEKEAKWVKMSALLEEEIQSAFSYKRWNAAKNIAREMLLCNQLCVSENARLVSIEGKPKVYSMIDFLNVVTRKAGPGESSQKVAEYKPLIQVLLKNNMPHSFVINKLLLAGKGHERREHNRHNPKRFRHRHYSMY